MIRARPKHGRHLGFDAAELGSPLARHWNPVLPPLARHVHDALAGPVAPPLLPSFEGIAEWLRDERPRLEDGFTVEGTRAQLMLRTELPGVSPRMVDWWFAWHSDDPARYKLWHPAAHVHATWGRRPPSAERCVGGVSIVDEYLGHELGRFAIAFLEPRTLGFRDEELATASVTVARVGIADAPIEAGYLLHHVKPVLGGSEMRSFFWLGGAFAGARLGGRVGEAVVSLGSSFLRPTLADARALLLHCAEEMSHLATFLPALHAEDAGG